MKIMAALSALLVAAFLISAPSALAWGQRHAFAGGTFTFQNRPFFVQRSRPIIVERRFFATHPFFVNRPFFVERRFFVERPFVLAPPILVAPPVFAGRPVFIERPFW